MKSFTQQTYYELLEVGTTATVDEIKSAYERAVELYGPDSPALYGLAEPGAADALRARLLEAMEILSDEDLRDEYDRSIGLPPRVKPKREEAPPEQLAMTDLLARADETPSTTHPEFRISYIPHPPRPDYESPPALAPLPSPVPAPVPALVEIAAPAPPPPIPIPVEVVPPPPPEVHGAAEPVPRAPEPPPPLAPAPPPPLPDDIDEGVIRGPRPLDQAPEIAQDAAIANAEAALAGVASKVREARADGGRKSFELAPEAEINGEILRQAREAKGMSLQVLGEKTRIATRHLENVEADRYDALPATVYLRGMLMSLARELGLDPLRVAKSYVGLVGKAKEGR